MSTSYQDHDDYDDDDRDEEDGYDDYDRDDYREPDPEDADIARSYEEHWEHRDQVHGGGECDCRPSPGARAWQLACDAGSWLAGPWARLKAASWQPWTFRVGPAEVTLRLRADRACGACGGRGWFYTLDRGRPDDRPEGYNGTALCGCGSATAQLAASRHRMRQWDKEPPF